jgi:hypothetical protein
MKTKPSMFLADKTRCSKNGCKPSLLPEKSSSSRPLSGYASLVTLEGIEGLVGVTNEWQTHLGFL